jgi:nucleoside-diphosphate-sugar epimerase
MARIVVTGCAGFIGSTISDALLARGDTVVGIDCFTPYYDEAQKRANLTGALADAKFELVEADLRTAELRELLDGVDVVYHEAAQPGVRLSWSSGFADYDSHNVLATQRLLEAAVAVGKPRVVYASSSSVYGQAARYPTTEQDLPKPHSPYGVTKLAAEHLCGLYAANWGLPTVSLRYFTVYGPRQRPDMAIHRLLEAGLRDEPFPLFGDGSALRDFTFVADAVAANLAAGTADAAPGTVVNVAGGGEISMADLIDLVGDVLGKPVQIDRRDPSPGDVDRTGGTVDAAQEALGWAPTVSVKEGVTAQAEWHRARMRA